MPTRSEVYYAVDTERAYQEAQKGNAARHTGAPAVMPVGEYLTYIRKCLRDAEEAAYRGSNGNIQALPFVRKIAALSVGCMENHGAPPRISQMEAA
jgi:hypothetical protein